MAVANRIITCMETKALHQTYNFSVCIRFKLGGSAGERAKFKAAAQRCISYKPDLKNSMSVILPHVLE